MGHRKCRSITVQGASPFISSNDISTKIYGNRQGASRMLNKKQQKSVEANKVLHT